MERFVNANTEGLNMSTLDHASLDSTPSILPINIRFYRGPLPATNTRPDNVFNYYMTRNFKSQRVLQPSLNGSL